MTREGFVSLHRFAKLTAAATFLLIVAGALVVGHDAGLSVPDWPLSYGQFFPPMTGNIFYEHGHRMIAGLVAVMTTMLAVWLWKVEPRAWVRWIGATAVFAVILQAVLGGITVIYLLPVPVLVAHACLAQTFFCIAVSLAVFTGPSWNSPPFAAPEDFSRFQRLALATTSAIFLQLVFGASLRHKALGLHPHLEWAFVVAALVLSVTYSALNSLPRSEKRLRSLAGWMGGLVVVQLALGFGSYLTRLYSQDAPQPEATMIRTTTTHVAVGALLLGISLAVTLLAYRRLPAPRKVLQFQHNPGKTMA